MAYSSKEHEVYETLKTEIEGSSLISSVSQVLYTPEELMSTSAVTSEFPWFGLFPITTEHTDATFRDKELTAEFVLVSYFFSTTPISDFYKYKKEIEKQIETNPEHSLSSICLYSRVTRADYMLTSDTLTTATGGTAKLAVMEISILAGFRHTRSEP